MRAAGDKTGEMRHVDHEVGAHGIGDGAEPSEIDDARISRTTGDDDLRLVRLGETGNFVVVDERVVPAHTVLHGVEPFAGNARRCAVGQMTTGRKRHTEQRIAGFHHRGVGGDVGLHAGMRLNIREAAAEQFLGALASELLGDIDVGTSAIVASSRISLGVLIGQHRSGRFENGTRNNVFRRDKLDLILLTRELALNRRVELRVHITQGGVEESGMMVRVRRDFRN